MRCIATDFVNAIEFAWPRGWTADVGEIENAAKAFRPMFESWQRLATGHSQHLQLLGQTTRMRVLDKPILKVKI